MKLQRVAQNLYRRQPGGIYYVVASVRNRKAMKSLRTLNRRKAESKLADALAVLRSSVTDGGTFAEVSEHWRRTVLAAKNLKPAARTYRESTLQRLFKDIPELKARPIGAITLADLQRWKAVRIQGASIQRFNNELGTLRMVFEYAIEHGLLTINPARRIHRERINTVETVVPTREQVVKLVAHLRKRSRTVEAANMVELLCYTGLRQREAAELRWDEIDLERGVFKVTGGKYGTKNRRPRIVPINAAFRNLLERLPRWQDRVLGSKDCHMSITRACHAIGLPHFSHHSFRHFFATDAIESGVNVRTLAQWLGHLDGGQLLLKTYAHVWPAQEREAADKMQFSAVASGSSMGHPVNHGRSNHSQAACG